MCDSHSEFLTMSCFPLVRYILLVIFTFYFQLGLSLLTVYFVANQFCLAWKKCFGSWKWAMNDCIEIAKMQTNKILFSSVELKRKSSFKQPTARNADIHLFICVIFVVAYIRLRSVECFQFQNL